MNGNRNSSRSESMSTTSKLGKTWASRRNYDDTLRAGTIPEGRFAGWFCEEKDLCEDFASAQQKLIDDKHWREKKHPRTYQEYLAIVNESERKPHSLLSYAGLFLLMVVVASGFSLIFYDRLSNTATDHAIQHYAVGISVVIACLALSFADVVGKAVYRQGYAHAAHLAAPGHRLEPSTNRGLGLDDDNRQDENEPQSTRIVNRSIFVANAATDARRQNKLIPRFPVKLWIYVAAVVAFGAMVGLVGMGQIDEFDAKAAFGLSKAAAPAKGELGTPPGMSRSIGGTNAAPPQELLDGERRGKQLTLGLVIVTFFLAQTLGVVLGAARGFASDYGEEAFKRIKAFREKHGDISFEQWQAMLQSEIEGVTRDVQQALTDWQSGLQSAFTAKPMQVPNEAYFAQCLRDSSRRTYIAAYFLLEEADALPPANSSNSVSG